MIQIRNKHRGFSLVELVIVIAIMAVMTAILVPALLNHVERSRMQKDETAMAELVNAISIAASNQKCNDEILQYTTMGNVSCFLDTKKEADRQDYKTILETKTEREKPQYLFTKESRLNDEAPYHAAGNMDGMTLTFVPKDGFWIIKDAIINKYIRDDTGDKYLTDDRVADALKYIMRKDAPNYTKTPTLASMTASVKDANRHDHYLYGNLRKTIGEKIPISSKTYKDSEFTVFISTNPYTKVVGQFNGTNLTGISYKYFETPPDSDTTTPIIPDSGGSGGGSGGGSSGGSGGTIPGGGNPQKPDPVNPLQATAYMDKNKFQNACKELPGAIVFSKEKAPQNKGIDITDLKKSPPGSVIAVIEGDNATIYSKDGGGVLAPEDSSALFSSMNRQGGSSPYLMQATKLDLQGLDTSKVTNMSFMFDATLHEGILDLSNFDTSNVTDMSYMFSLCYVEDIDFPLNFGSAATNMRAMFNNCEFFKTFDLSNFNTSNVTNMSYMFYQCLRLTNLDLSSFDTSNVTDMSYMFQECEALKSLNLSGKFNTSQVTTMRTMFSRCGNLASLDLSNFDTSKVTNMDSMFSRCNNVEIVWCRTQADIDKMKASSHCAAPEAFRLKVKGAGNQFEKEMFQNVCKNLTGRITFSTESYPGAGGIRLNGTSETDATVFAVIKGQDATIYSRDGGGVLAPIDSSNLFSQFAMNGGDLSGLDTSKVTNMSKMFYGCKKLTGLKMSTMNTSQVTDMSGMFSGCSKLMRFDVSHFDTSKVTNMGGMFERCSYLTSFDLSNFDTSNVINMGRMFYWCNSLTELNLSSFDTSKVLNMSGMFEGCIDLTQVWCRTPADIEKMQASSDCTAPPEAFNLK